jgi:hypothetical protein
MSEMPTNGAKGGKMIAVVGFGLQITEPLF